MPYSTPCCSATHQHTLSQACTPSLLPLPLVARPPPSHVHIQRADSCVFRCYLYATRTGRWITASPGRGARRGRPGKTCFRRRLRRRCCCCCCSRAPLAALSTACATSTCRHRCRRPQREPKGNSRHHHHHGTCASCCCRGEVLPWWLLAQPVPLQAAERKREKTGENAPAPRSWGRRSPCCSSRCSGCRRRASSAAYSATETVAAGASGGGAAAAAWTVSSAGGATGKEKQEPRRTVLTRRWVRFSLGRRPPRFLHQRTGGDARGTGSLGLKNGSQGTMSAQGALRRWRWEWWTAGR